MKGAHLSEASPVTSITFVDDEDVVADRLPVSAAKKKDRKGRCRLLKR